MEKAFSPLIPPFQNAFDTLSEYFFITDTTSKVLYTNPAIEEHTGFSQAEVIGKKPGELWGGEMPRSFYEGMWHTISKERKPFVGQVVNKKKNQTQYSDTIYIAPALQNNKIDYFLALHPRFQNSHEKQTFEKELSFLIYNSQENGFLFLQKVLEWSGRTQFSLPSSQEIISLSDILHEIFIVPTQTRYRHRTEDSELITLSQKKSDAFGELYLKYKKEVYHYFLKHLPWQKNLAEDFTQETFLKAFSHVADFVPRNASYSTYLLRIAHNILVNHYRSKIMLPLDEEKTLTQTKHDQWISHYTLKMVLKQLPPTDQEILGLMYDQQYSIREIAEKMQKSENAVKLQVSRARKKLRDMLNQ